MKQAIADVVTFHRAIGAPVLESPAIPSMKRVKLRIELINEEVNRELLPALRQAAWSDGVQAGDIYLQLIADGIADSIVVLLGTAAEFGIPIERVWDEVMAANMRKTKGPQRADWKQLKPPGWKPPDIAGCLWPKEQP